MSVLKAVHVARPVRYEPPPPPPPEEPLPLPPPPRTTPKPPVRIGGGGGGGGGNDGGDMARCIANGIRAYTGLPNISAEEARRRAQQVCRDSGGNTRWRGG